MTIASPPAHGSISRHAAAAPAALPMPPWVRSCVSSQEETIGRTDTRTIKLAHSHGRCAISVRVRRAGMLGPLELQRETVEAYRCIAAAAQGRSARLIRLWNFIPDIGGRLGDSFRYMVFNAGRFAAYHDWFGGTESFDSLVPTATGVGHESEDLVIYALGSDRPGVHLMNPRQRPPRCYSSTYGDFPPCFARATLIKTDIAHAGNLLIGGTAAVRGETSMAPGDAEGQTLETFRNLEKLVRTAESAVLSSPISRARHAERSEASPGQPGPNALEILRCAQNTKRQSEPGLSRDSGQGRDSARDGDLAQSRDLARAGELPRKAIGLEGLSSPWSSFRSLRVYLRRPADEPIVRTLVLRRFPHLEDVEFLKADICRPELLVEIEGTALIG